MNTKWINRTLNLVVIMALVLTWLPASSATAAAASGAQAAQMLPVEALLKPDGTLNTSSGASGALDLRGWNVTLDSARGPILTKDAPVPAALDAESWSALANKGLRGTVYALAVMGSDLYVGGAFDKTADGTVINLNTIAKYSGGAWSALANNGLNNSVNALAVMGSDLYVGGMFTHTADGTMANLHGIAKYSGGVWSALANNGLNNGVLALAVMGSDLYVGGWFTQTYDGTVTNLNNIAKYSGDAWSALANNGLKSGDYCSVDALAVMGSDLYVGGWFTQTTDGTVTNLNNIAKYSGGAWSALANNGLNDVVIALAVMGSDLYIGGAFSQTSDGTVTGLHKIAKYSGGAWSALANNGLTGWDNEVITLAVSGSDLYVGGSFTQTYDGTVTNLNLIARYSDGAWSALANNGLNHPVYALAVSGSDLYVGGGFSQTADGSVVDLNYIARLEIPVPPNDKVYLPLVIR